MRRERALYLIGGSALCIPTIRTAQRLGWRVICTDKDAWPPARAQADYFWERVGGTEVERHRVTIQVAKVDGLDIQACYCPAEFGRRALQAIRAELGLPDNPPEVYETLADKERTQERLHQAGITTPWAFARDKDTRWVVKPRRGSGGSSGVGFVTTRQLTEIDTTGYLVEPYIEGRGIDVNGYLEGGKLTPCGLLEKVVLPGPHPVPMAGWTLLAGESSIAHLVLERACQALGLTEGPVKADMILTRDGELVVLEVEPRFHGDITTAGCLPPIGIDPMATLLGGAPAPPRARYAAWWVLWLPPGRLLEVPELPQTEGVTLSWWNPKIRAGDVIQPPSSTRNVPGYLAIAGESREHVWKLREAWRRELRLVMEPLGDDTRDDLDGLLLKL